ncbi:aldo/keto reductase [Oceanirhabdus sp. W0125-5]|uniref:aldo/keto reductase n=1 Tax=Oceanirhabdus sp. W0125-5 TaxID=2999116 RepID=UPI0022F2D5E3|nr:aldo/keto reductase [Oceanirhabdus sp. W0125-5]WBW97367.1 aldo/keto reductase [Oceanirhabdus sp. W0125-5]
MLYRELAGEKVSILGFGCMRFPTIDNDTKNINKELVMEMMRYAIDNGVNYVDTAIPYHGQMSEPLVGEVLQEGYREKVKLATKLSGWYVKEYDDFRKMIEGQLVRLKTDFIDFYLVHALDRESWDKLKDLGVIQFLDEIKSEGKVKHIGFSFHGDYNEFEYILQDYSWEFCQIQLNYLDEEYQAGVKGLKYAKNKGLDVIIMEPLRGGRIVNNISQPIKDIMNKSKENKTPIEWALRYVWNFPEVSLILSGMSEMSHVRENILLSNKGYSNNLIDEDLEILKEVNKYYKKKIKVDCTDCKYCMPCPAGVNIPACFELYNDASMFEDVEGVGKMYNRFISDEKKASNCVDCGKCIEKCPQNINIPEKLKDVVGTFGK